VTPRWPTTITCERCGSPLTLMLCGMDSPVEVLHKALLAAQRDVSALSGVLYLDAEGTSITRFLCCPTDEERPSQVARSRHEQRGQRE